MRAIGVLPNEKDAKAFAGFLLSLKIQTQLRAGKDGTVVWVLHEDRVDEAKREYEAYRQNPNDPRYESTEEIVRRVKRDMQAKEKEFQKNYHDLSHYWNYELIAPRRRPITILLVCACVAVGFFTRLGDANPRLIDALSIASHEIDETGVVVEPFAKLEQIRAGEIWRLFTPALLHFGPIHLLFNILWLYSLGGIIEARRGVLRLALIVLLSAAISNLAQYYWSGPNFGGMSGVVYALFGYMLVQGWVYDDATMRLNPRTINLMMIWLVLCMLNVFGAVANAAHLIGLASGLALGMEPARTRL